MVQLLKVSTAADVILGPFVDSTDGVTAETALTISQADIRLSKNGAAFAQTNNATGATHRENGHYLIPLDSTDTNTVGRLRVAVNESGALPCWLDLHIVPANVYDSLVGGTDTLNADVTQFGGTNGTFASGRPEVNSTHWGGTAVASATVSANVTQISGDSVAADNLEAAADGTGYNLGNGSIVAASVTGAVGSVTGNVGGNVTGSVGSVASGGITSASFGSGAITATVIAANAIGASELAADAATEIAAAVWDEVLSGHLTAGSTGAALNAAGSAGDPWTTTLPGSYTGSQAGKMLSDILTDTAEIGSAGAGLTALASAANLATLTGYVDTEVSTIVTQTTAASIRSAVGLASANLDTQLGTIDTNVDFILDDTGTSGVVVASLAAGSITAAAIASNAIDADALATDAVTEIVTGVLTTQMTESYRGTGAAPTLAQAQFELIAHMGESAISSTTKTLKKLDGSTTAKTYTLDSATTPTSITETT